jgi:hypothetical protein
MRHMIDGMYICFLFFFSHNIYGVFRSFTKGNYNVEPL